jgi:hypothetical protein
MNNQSAYTTPTLLSPKDVWDRIDPLASDMDAEPSVAGLGALPYAQLLGPGFVNDSVMNCSSLRVIHRGSSVVAVNGTTVLIS